jgi:hypothetical protein
MKKKNILIVICVFILFSCCTGRDNIQETKALYVINVDNLKYQDTIYASSFFKNVRTIILEDHDDAIIGEIRDIQVFDDYIFVLDEWRAKKLFVFDRNGKYLRQIGRWGQGPGEYLRPDDFCIDTAKREIYILDNDSRKAHKYNLDDGKYISSIDLPGDTYCFSISFAYDRLYIKITHFDQQKNDNMLMEIDIKTGKPTEYLSAKDYNLGWNENVSSDFFISEQVPLKYVEMFMNTVFSIEQDSIYPYLSINSKDWMQKGDNLTMRKFENGLTQAYNIHNYFEYTDYIHLRYNYRINKYTVIYNKKTNYTNLYKFSQNDLLVNKGYVHTNYYYVDYKTSKAYEYFTGEDFNYLIKQRDKFNLAPGLDKREELMNLDDEQVVIFEYEFK